MAGSLVRCLSLVALLCAVPASAQIPDTFTNLEVLDPDTSKREIVGIMRSWAGSLGVRCTHCHVGPDNLVGMDFASDEKPSKRTARQMLEMARAINRQHLNDLPVTAEGGSRQNVSCYTCHRGEVKPPRNLRSLLAETHQASGVGAAIKQMNDLRERHQNDGRYDLSPRNLAAVGGRLVEEGALDDAVTWFEALLAMDSEEAAFHAGIGAVHLAAGRRDEAKVSFEAALALDADNGTARFGMARLAQTEPEG